MDELKEYFATNGTKYSKENEQKWFELKRLLASLGHHTGSVRCGSCRRKMFDLLTKLA